MDAHLSLLLSLLQAFLHRIRQNVADLVEKGLTEENVKVWTLELASWQTVPAAVCLASPRMMLRGCLGGWGLPAAARGLSILQANQAWRMSGGLGLRPHSPTQDFLPLLNMTILPSSLLVPGPLAWSQWKIPSQACLEARQPSPPPYAGH